MLQVGSMLTQKNSYAGIATHYLHSSSLPDLEARFAELRFRDGDDYQTRLKIIDSAIEEYNTGLPHDQPISAPVGGDIRKAVDFVFQDGHSLESMMGALQTIADAQEAQQNVKDWALNTIKTIKKRSPTSLKVTVRQLQEGSKWNIRETFDRELKLAANFMKHHDFVEGVTALLINKPKTEPRWQPADDKDVSKADVDAMFDGSAQFRSVRSDRAKPYREYPHAWTALPSEKEIELYVRNSTPASQASTVDHFTNLRNGKVGVKEKVQEVLERKTQLDQTRQHLVWRH